MVKILESKGTPGAVKALVLREARKIKAEDRERVFVDYLRAEAGRWQRYHDEGYQAWRDGKQAAVPEEGNDDTELYPVMMERKSVRKPLSPGARRRIADLVEGKLRGRQELAVAWSAIHIAAKSGNPRLLARAKQLAREERAAREISGDADEVQQIRQEAVAALKAAEVP